MNHVENEKHVLVREGYADIASRYAGGEGVGALSGEERARLGRQLGYSDEQLAAQADANLGLGCGNPHVLAALRPGDRVLDLGSGAGFDALLAAEQVGPDGHVIGVDMTDEMVTLARSKAEAAGVRNVEFRRGLIEELPVESGSVDVLISNCVINLSPDKRRVFAEACRVLRPGGWLSVTDVVLNVRLPKIVLRMAGAWVGCLAGATLKDEYLRIVQEAGFRDVEVGAEVDAIAMVPADLMEKIKTQFDVGGIDLRRLPANAVSSIRLRASKPAEAAR